MIYPVMHFECTEADLVSYPDPLTPQGTRVGMERARDARGQSDSPLRFQRLPRKG